MNKAWLYAWILPAVMLITWLYNQSQLDFYRFDTASEKIESFYRYSSQFEQSIAQQIIATYPDYKDTNDVFSNVIATNRSLHQAVNDNFPLLDEIMEPLFTQLKEHLDKQESTLLLFYEKNSVLRNTKAYLLSFATNSNLLNEQLKIYLLNSLIKTNSNSVFVDENLKKVISHLKEVQSTQNKEEAQLILRHLSIYQDHLQLIDGLLVDLTSSTIIEKMKSIDDALNAHYIQSEQSITSYKRYLFIASILLLCGLVLAAYRLDKSNKQHHKLLEEKFMMQEMMIQSEKMLSVGGLAAGMAHEINNPLAGIVQNLQVIQNRLSSKLPKNLRVAETCNFTMENLEKYLEQRDIHNMIDAVLESGQRAAKIVNNTLSFSRKGVGIRTNENINDIIGQTLNLSANDYDLKKKYDFRKIIITKNYAANLSSVSCEASEIQQVLFNIFKNGAQAMMSDDIKLEAKPEFIITTRQEKSSVTIKIQDNGPGMHEDIRKRIFEPFFTTKSPGVGTGLGLSVSYFIVTKNHQGEMAVESIDGVGTTFIINLPLDPISA